MGQRSAASMALLVVAAVGGVLVAAAAAAPAAQLGAEYCANDTLVNMPVWCSDHEKSCLSLNLLFHPPSNQCLPLGYVRNKCLYAADQYVFDNGAGRLQATCQFPRVCGANGPPPLAWSGRCGARGARCPGGKAPGALHLLGGAECACSPPVARAPRPPRRLQPTEPGRCVVPDFTRDLHAHAGDPVRVVCPPEQARCTGTDEVWFRGACYPLLQRGPCRPNHIVVLRRPRRNLGRGRRNPPDGEVQSIATCEREDGGCQTGRDGHDTEGRIILAADGNCHDRLLFSGQDVRTRRDAYGRYRLSFGATRHRGPLMECVRADLRTGEEAKAKKQKKGPEQLSKKRRRGKGRRGPRRKQGHKGARRQTEVTPTWTPSN